MLYCTRNYKINIENIQYFIKTEKMSKITTRKFTKFDYNSDFTKNYIFFI